jgi:hypothetical protein
VFETLSEPLVFPQGGKSLAEVGIMDILELALIFALSR